jgi:hypothetical protein
VEATQVEQTHNDRKKIGEKIQKREGGQLNEKKNVIQCFIL